MAILWPFNILCIVRVCGEDDSKLSAVPTPASGDGESYTIHNATVNIYTWTLSLCSTILTVGSHYQWSYVYQHLEYSNWPKNATLMLQSHINDAILSYHTDHSQPPGPLIGLRVRPWCHRGNWYQIMWQEWLKSYKGWQWGEQDTVLLPPPRWADWRWEGLPLGWAGYTHFLKRTRILDSPTHTWKFRQIASKSSKLMCIWCF